jgi:opacity protein-like surface antigen
MHAWGPRLRLVLLLIAWVAFASASRAQDPYSRPGGYVSGGIGGAFQNFRGDFDPLGAEVSNAFVVGGRIGRRAHRFLAFDASVDYTVVGFDLSTDASQSVDAKTLLGFTNMRLMPIGGRIQPFALAGAGILWADLECSDPSGGIDCASAGFDAHELAFAGRFGGGLDVYLTRHLMVSGELAYVMPTGDLADMRFLTFGAQVVLRF